MELTEQQKQGQIFVKKAGDILFKENGQESALYKIFVDLVLPLSQKDVDDMSLDELQKKGNEAFGK